MFNDKTQKYMKFFANNNKHYKAYFYIKKVKL